MIAAAALALAGCNTNAPDADNAETTPAPAGEATPADTSATPAP